MPKGKGLALLLGLDKKGEEDEPDEDTDQAMSDAGDNLIAAIKADDGAGVAQAIRDIVDLG